MSPDDIPKELLTELSDSEKKLTALFEKRDHFNEEAKTIREMRDDLHERRRKVFDQIADIRAKKGQLVEEMKAAKSRRDMYNEKARRMSGGRRSRDSEKKEELTYEDINTLTRDLEKLQKQYETMSHTLEKERDIVKAIDEKRRKLQELKAKEPDFKAERIQAETLEEEIKEYRRLADQEHALVQELYLKLKEINEELDEYRPTIDHLRKEADKRHEEYIKVRKQADSYHQKATELREKVLQLRDERNKLRKEARAVVEDQNKKVKDELEDQEKLDDAADKAVDVLLKKGKITL